MNCPHCDSPLLLSQSGLRLICTVCWTDQPAGTPELFAEWREDGVFAYTALWDNDETLARWVERPELEWCFR